MNSAACFYMDKQGKEPLPLHPIPKTNLAVYTKDWIHPMRRG